MKDTFHRNINYIRVSVTDRCNLRCFYCMPAEGVKLINHNEILTLEETAKVIEAAALTGISRVRFTGGEPLVRKGIVELIKLVGKIPGIEDISLTTNGILLSEMASDLKKAGLKRVNISLDTLVPEKYTRITRIGNFHRVWSGIEKALKWGLEPVKINTVIIRGINDNELQDFVNLTLKMPLHVRFIELMPIGVSRSWAADNYMSVAEIFKVITDAGGKLIPKKGVKGSGPAKYFTVPNALGTVGFISPISNHFCESCNRIRLTAEGQLRPCLYSWEEIDVKTAIRNNASIEELADIIKLAVAKKPLRHNMNEFGWGENKRVMTQIGG